MWNISFKPLYVTAKIKISQGFRRICVKYFHFAFNQKQSKKEEKVRNWQEKDPYLFITED